jgi:hypothetical protein
MYYCKFFLGVVFLLLCIVASFNWWFDPYFIFRQKNYDATRPVLMSKQTSLAKALYVSKLHPRGLILGSSRAQLAIDPDHPGWAPKARPIYNLALPGANMYQIWRYFQHAQSIMPLEEVLVGLDFFGFNIYFPPTADFDESFLVVTPEGESSKNQIIRIIDTLLTSYTVKSSWNRIKKEKKPTHLLNGMELYEPSNGGVTEKVFLRSPIPYLNHMIFPPPSRKFCLYDEYGNSSAFNSVKALIREARKNHITLHLVIHPIHASQLFAIDQVGLLPYFEEWKRKLFHLVNEGLKAHNYTENVYLWDFGYYNSVTEEMPSQEIPNVQMKWYIDGVHYKKELGNLILNRIFGGERSDPLTPDDFGVRIRLENIESHLQVDRKKGRKYRERYQKKLILSLTSTSVFKKKTNLYGCQTHPFQLSGL